MGDSSSPLIFVGIACVVNIIGDLILVAGFHMDVAGAAIATVTAQAVSVVLSLLIVRKKQLPFQLKKQDIRFGKEIKTVVRIGFPLALQEILTNVTFLSLCAFVNRLGLDASSGYGIAQKIQSFVLLIPSSLFQCMASFVAQNVGARKEDRAKRGMLYGMMVGCGIGFIIAFLAFFKGDAMSAIFSSDPAAIQRSFEYLQGFAPEAVVTCILFSFMGYFNGHSRSMFVMLQGVAQSVLVRLPMAYVMSIQPDASLTGIALAAPAATCFGILLCFLYYLKLQKEIKTGRFYE
jgi:Na+-driven multidrug efflux pump